MIELFREHMLIHFGDFQDAMHTDQDYLFHSRVSFAMNSQTLKPDGSY
jgi:deoxyribodipyrimidine photolyase-related protein